MVQTIQDEFELRHVEALRAAMSPIIPFLDDDLIVEVLLNADGSIWTERAGQGMELTGATMKPEDAFRMIQLIASGRNIEITDRQPSLAALLPVWGARIQAMIPPIVEAPIFTIRKRPRKVFTLANYVHRGILTPHQAEVLREAVAARLNILVGGSTGAGKTTLANALLDEIGSSTTDRVYLVEDLRELQCSAANKVSLFVQPPIYTWQRAIMDAMRSRPDRIVVGEVRDGAATLELVKAWNTGHPGGLATVHANDTGAMLDRICQLIEEVTPHAPRSFVAQTINLCVHIQRDPKHPAGRSLSGIDRVSGLRPDGGWQLAPVPMA